MITSIAYPTEAVAALAALSGWKLVVVGDEKTPPDWAYPGVVYLSVEQQKQLTYKTVQHLPWRSYGCEMRLSYIAINFNRCADTVVPLFSV